MMMTLLSAAIEYTLNQVMALEPSLKADLQPTRDQVLSVALEDLNLHCGITFTGSRLMVFMPFSESSDCHIQTSLTTLSELKDPSQITKLIRAGDLDLDGDLHLAQAYSKAFNQVEIDWAEHLSKVLGDALAQKLVDDLKWASQHAQNKHHILAMTFTQLCQDELKVTPHPLEMDTFKHQTRHLSQQLDALEQRVKTLQQD